MVRFLQTVQISKNLAQISSRPKTRVPGPPFQVAVAFRKGKSPAISGKTRLVKYYFIWPDKWPYKWPNWGYNP